MVFLSGKSASKTKLNFIFVVTTWFRFKAMLAMLTVKYACYAIQVISEAFSSMGGVPHDGGRLGWSTICTKLQSMGEQVSEEELVHCLEVRHHRVQGCAFPVVHVRPY